MRRGDFNQAPNSTETGSSIPGDHSRPRRQQLAGNAVRGPQGERENGKRRIGPTAGRKQRTSGNVQVGKAMDSAPAIGHAAARIGRHAGGAHMVETADRMGAYQFVADPVLGGVVKPAGRLNLPKAEPLRLPVKRGHEPGRTRLSTYRFFMTATPSL